MLSFDGQISFDSTYGIGSRFTFTFKLFSKDQAMLKQGLMNAGQYLSQLPKFDSELLIASESDDNFEENVYFVENSR